MKPIFKTQKDSFLLKYLEVPKKCFIFAPLISHDKMKTKQEYIDILRGHATELQEKFGITYMRLFGSVAKNMHGENSDVDVFVVMPPTAYNVVAANILRQYWDA